LKESLHVYYTYIVTKVVQVPTSWLLHLPLTQFRPGMNQKVMPTQFKVQILSFFVGLAVAIIQLHHSATRSSTSCSEHCELNSNCHTFPL